jgi:hypothetical protein
MSAAPTRNASILLAALLALQFPMAMAVATGPAAGDELYYVAKARYIAQHRAFERASAHQLAIEDGRELGWSEWRPPGYPLFVALCMLVPRDLRRVVTVMQFAAMALAIAVAFATIAPLLPPRRQLIAAAVLGIAPWPLQYVMLISPDSLNGALTTLGLLVLWRARSRATFLCGALLLSSTLLLRPEMIALIPFTLLAALLLRGLRKSEVIAAAAACAIFVGALYAYRAHFTGRIRAEIFGPAHMPDLGAFAWANSWLGTEREAYEDFAYALTNGAPLKPLPDRAFANERERSAVNALLQRVRTSGYNPEVDASFAALARQRQREHPVMAGLLPRVWHTIHPWMNTDLNYQLLDALASWPRVARLAVFGAMLVLKLALLVAFVIAVAQALRRRGEWQLVLLLATFVIARTLLMGFVLNWMVSRYMLAAWLPLIVAALFTLKGLRHPERSRETWAEGGATA